MFRACVALWPRIRYAASKLVRQLLNDAENLMEIGAEIVSPVSLGGMQHACGYRNECEKHLPSR